ncbi:hypothetical protein F4823DRAFT_221288 [Ustulina deusta]|nr:hypothetical protein F4823DRAFT_221288 [Ustulina deusta]
MSFFFLPLESVLLVPLSSSNHPQHPTTYLSRTSIYRYYSSIRILRDYQSTANVIEAYYIRLVVYHVSKHT